LKLRSYKLKTTNYRLEKPKNFTVIINLNRKFKTDNYIEENTLGNAISRLKTLKILLWLRHGCVYCGFATNGYILLNEKNSHKNRIKIGNYITINNCMIFISCLPRVYRIYSQIINESPLKINITSLGFLNSYDSFFVKKYKQLFSTFIILLT